MRILSYNSFLDALYNFAILCFQIPTLIAAIPIAYIDMCYHVVKDMLIALVGFNRREGEEIRNIVITGASSGLGANVAMSFAKPGRHIVLVARNQDRLTGVSNNCQALGASTEIQSIDIRDEEKLKKYLLDVDSRVPGGIDLVLANAGVTSESEDYTDQPLDEITKQVVGTNIYGVFNTISPLITRFKERRRGHVVIMGSASGWFAFPQFLVYAATKAAINSFTRDLRYVLSPYNIKVTLVTPGFVRTKMTAALEEDGKSTMPWFQMMDAKEAGGLIVKGIESGVDNIAFPFLEHWLTWLGRGLPPRYAEWSTAFSGWLKVGGERWT
ncbi:hypothetical protein BKA69DRAFT_1128203 [Paraphysoderma sedebokerense]|nr:hypothetical protein BKA69DRAFT_1128203 [Paraphysoderma sedebokerense]